MLPGGGDVECRAGQVARAFFEAATKLSEDNEDILPQEDAPDLKLSVFFLFSELFPEFACDKDKDKDGQVKNGLMRLQFNKIGYEIYDKEQSRRVPAVRAKPGNPGYGFRRARWRNTLEGEDRRLCETVLRGLGVSVERIERVKVRVNDIRAQWEAVRRPSRPAGPGRPRGNKRSTWDIAGTPVPGREVSISAAADVPKKSKKLPREPVAKRGPKEDGKALNKDVPLAAVAVSWTCSDAVKAEPATAVASSSEMTPEEEEARQVEQLVEENQSLRSLNMSLMYEREQLIKEVVEEENNIRRLRKGIDVLIADVRSNALDGSRMSSAFSWLADKLYGSIEEGKDRHDTLSLQQKEVLENCFDRFDDFERAGRKRSLLASSLPLRRELTKFLRGTETGGASQDLKVVDDDTLLEGAEAGGSLGDEKTVDFLFHHPSF